MSKQALSREIVKNLEVGDMVFIDHSVVGNYSNSKDGYYKLTAIGVCNKNFCSNSSIRQTCPGKLLFEEYKRYSVCFYYRGYDAFPFSDVRKYNTTITKLFNTIIEEL